MKKIIFFFILKQAENRLETTGKVSSNYKAKGAYSQLPWRLSSTFSIMQMVFCFAFLPVYPSFPVGFHRLFSVSKSTGKLQVKHKQITGKTNKVNFEILRDNVKIKKIIKFFIFTTILSIGSYDLDCKFFWKRVCILPIKYYTFSWSGLIGKSQNKVAERC